MKNGALVKLFKTIAFLLSQNNKKSIVVTPTSLIFNWKSEFEKFAPDIKLAVAYGSKSHRQNILENYKEYDVILTSYGTFKNDIEKYNELNFDYCVIDEAQNIKNPDSLITKAIKTINADVRFALSGTPVENNLSELWSPYLIFILPGYLYDKNKS
ncbi:MAG: SNF2-related protein [Terrisporobacter sp.]